MTWEQWLGLIALLGPLYGKFLLELYRKRNGGGQQNPNQEHHALAQRVEELCTSVDELRKEITLVDKATIQSLNLLERNGAVISEKVQRLETRTEAISNRLHTTQTQVTALLLKGES